ncbi:MAG: hypothetical protein JST30_17145 [Armatimonadetes bacterium]|nr:hypothetical protein [Armatimonadota bacterium]
MRLAAVLVSSFVLVLSAFAADATGSWSGKIQMDVSKLPAEAKAQATKALAKVKVTMVFKKDKTFTSKVTGSPDGVDHATSGTWSQSGDKVVLKAKTRDGKSAPTSQAQTFTISADGKKMSSTTRASNKPGGKPQANAPSVTIVLVRQK